jgi:hypothetical protein
MLVLRIKTQDDVVRRSWTVLAALAVLDRVRIRRIRYTNAATFLGQPRKYKENLNNSRFYLQHSFSSFYTFASNI